MPGKSTYYSRIQIMLELAGARKSRSSEEFIQGIVRKSPPNFVYHRWDPDKEEISAKCSESVARRTFELACELGLMDRESGALTKDGKVAADPTRFDLILRRKLSSYLQEQGCSVKNLEAASMNMLQSNPVVLPAADELYLAEGGDLPLYKFRTLLRLLASCGGIAISRRHIFLPK